MTAEGKKGSVKENPAVMKPNRTLLLVVVGTLLLSLVAPHVNAFGVIDEAICKGIDWQTLTCLEKTSEFHSADGWVYFWIKGTLDRSEDTADVELRFYEPSGNMFTSTEGLGWAMKPFVPGETVVWMGIGISSANREGGFVSSKANTSEIEGAVKRIREMTPMPAGIFTFDYSYDGQRRLSYDVWADYSPKPASGMPGEWRAEFLLNGKSIVGERFTILEKATTTEASTSAEIEPSTRISLSTPTGTGMPSNDSVMVLVLPLIGVIAALGVIVAVYVKRKRGEASTQG